MKAGNTDKLGSAATLFNKIEHQRRWDECIQKSKTRLLTGDSPEEKTEDMAGQKEIVSVKMWPDKKRQLETYAKEHGTSVSGIVNDAVDSLLGSNICFFCGANIPAGGHWCPFCGEKIRTDEEYHIAATKIRDQMMPDLEKRLSVILENKPDFIKDIRYVLVSSTDGKIKSFRLTILATTEDDEILPTHEKEMDVEIPQDMLKETLKKLTKKEVSEHLNKKKET